MMLTIKNNHLTISSLIVKAEEILIETVNYNQPSSSHCILKLYNNRYTKQTERIRKFEK